MNLSLKRETIQTNSGMILAIVVAFVLLFNLDIPFAIVDFYATGLGMMSIFSIVGYLFYTRQFVLGILAVLFVLKLNIAYQYYFPGETKKQAMIMAYKQHLNELSLEEEMVAKKAPMVSEYQLTSPPPIASLPYLPIMSDAHGATIIG